MTAGAAERPAAVRLGVAVWGVGAFAALLVRAIWSLTPRVIDALRPHDLSRLQIAALIGWVGFMAYSEGYKGFQRQMSPRVAARAMYAGAHGGLYLAALAPLFCMGLVHATRKRLAISWGILIGVIALVIAVQRLAQPWRGIVDAGVVVGLSWGLVATLWCFAAALAGRGPDVPLDLPA